MAKITTKDSCVVHQNTILNMKHNRRLLDYTIAITLTSTVLTAAAPLVATFVDGLFVGNMLGSDAFNAINVIMPISNLITVITLICSMGGSVLAARALALRNYEHASKVFTISMLSAVTAAGICIVLLYAFMDSFAHFICSDAGAIPYIKDYLSILLLYFFFVPFNSTLNNFISQEGYPDLTTKIVIVSNVVNVLLDVVFMSFLGMGIKGAALATVVSGVINVVAYLPHFAKKKSNYQLVKLSVKDFAVLKNSIVQGIAFNVFYIMFNGLVFFTNRLILSALGSAGMLTYGVCLQIQSFTFCITVGAAIAGIAQINRLQAGFVPDKVAYVIRRMLQFTTLCYTCIMLVMSLFPATVASTFGIQDPAILASCRFPFVCFSVFYLCFAILAVYSTVSFQLMGHVMAKFVFIFGLGIIVYLFMHAFSLISPEMLWWGFPVGGITMLALSFVFGYIHHKKNPMLTMFTLVDKMPDAILMQDTVKHDCSNLPDVMERLHLFTQTCELSDHIFKGIELCCTEYCEHLSESKLPTLARSFDVIFQQQPGGISLVIESAGAPNSVILDEVKLSMMRENSSELSKEEIRRVILSTVPNKIDYRYMFGLNITVMSWESKNMEVADLNKR